MKYYDEIGALYILLFDPKQDIHFHSPLKTESSFLLSYSFPLDRELSWGECRRRNTGCRSFYGVYFVTERARCQRRLYRCFLLRLLRRMTASARGCIALAAPLTPCRFFSDPTIPLTTGNFSLTASLSYLTMYLHSRCSSLSLAGLKMRSSIFLHCAHNL